VTDAKTPKEFLEKVLPFRFKPEKAAGIDVIVNVRITGPNGGDWTVKIKNQKLETNEGIYPSPSMELAMEESDYMDLINGKLSGEKAFLTGKVKFKGNIGLALRLKETGFI
jgi:putative sterol carrier protein